MAEIRLSAAARADLRDIRKYSLAKFGSAAADEYLRGFKRVFSAIGDRPLLGVAQPVFGPAVRRFTHKRHRILYRLDGDTVRVMRILHHARHIDPATLDS